MKKLQLLKHKKILFAVVGAFIVISTIVMMTRPKADIEEDMIWREYPVTYNDITASLDGGGALEATGVHHSFDVDLKVEQILAAVGQEVKTGDVLVKYSVSALNEKITELNASLQKAQRALEDAKSNKQKTLLENGLNTDKTQRDSATAFEGSQREIENAIRTAEQKIKQLQERITKLKQEIENMKASSDGSTNSNELKKLTDELAKLKEELGKLESDGVANNNDEQIRSLEQQRLSLQTQLKEVNDQIDAIAGAPDESDNLAKLQKQKADLENQILSIDAQINSLKNAATNTDSIKKKQAQIDEVLKKITALSSKEGKVVSLNEELQRAQADLEGAQFELETQKNTRNTFNGNHDKQTGQDRENQSTKEQINALTNTTLDNAMENAQAEVEKIRKDLADAKEILTTPELTANADGVVTKLECVEGDNVLAGKSIVTVGNSEEKRVVTQVSQEDIVGVEVGQEVEMQFLAVPDETLKGHVLERSLVPSEGGEGITYKVTIAFDGEQPELLQGMTCSVKFVLKRVEHVLTLSNKAITLKDGKQIVTVLLADGTHEEREIQTGFSDGRVSEITGGLSDGETVVTEG